MDVDVCDYYFYGDTRNRRGYGLTKHNTGYRERIRINYIKEKRRMQSEKDKAKFLINEETENNDKCEVETKEENYGNNYTPIEKKNKKKKQPKKGRVRF